MKRTATTPKTAAGQKKAKRRKSMLLLLLLLLLTTAIVFGSFAIASANEGVKGVEDQPIETVQTTETTPSTDADKLAFDDNSNSTSTTEGTTSKATNPVKKVDVTPTVPTTEPTKVTQPETTKVTQPATTSKTEPTVTDTGDKKTPSKKTEEIVGEDEPVQPTVPSKDEIITPPTTEQPTKDEDVQDNIVVEPENEQPEVEEVYTSCRGTDKEHCHEEIGVSGYTHIYCEDEVTSHRDGRTVWYPWELYVQ
jgi:FtsZ-interacting cell division protein ZipA